MPWSSRHRTVLLCTIAMMVTATRCTDSTENGPGRAVRVEWLQTNSIPIRTIAPADTNFSDLAALGAAIGNSRVVMLGEQSHGDGPVFLMKTRLIKYLHERMNFDVLAFESGLYDMKQAWDFMQKGEDPLIAARRGIFGVWSGSEQLLPLLDYVGERSKTNRPLELAGFDSQISVPARAASWLPDCVAFLNEHHIDTLQVPQWTDSRALLDSLLRFGFLTNNVPSLERQTMLLTALDTLVRRVGALASSDVNTMFWKQNLKSVRALAPYVFAAVANNPTNANFNLRDAQMAENLLWLARTRYPSRKIIVWAASAHNLRTAPEVKYYEGLRTMGSIYAKEMGTESYNIAFVASEGSAGRWFQNSATLPRVHSESIEGLWAATTHNVAMVDFRGLPADGSWLRGKLLSGPLGFSQMATNWTNAFDALIYTRVMSPSTKASR